MTTSGAPTTHGIPKFADTDVPDLAAGGLGLILDTLDTLMGAYKIANVTLGATAASIDIQNIPQNFAHLLAIGNLGEGTGGGDATLLARVNAISSGTYIWNGFLVSNGTPSYPSLNGATLNTIGVAADNAGQVMLSPLLLLIPHYANNDKPQMLSLSVSNGFGSITSFYAGSNQNVGAVNRLTLTNTTGNFRAGSRLTLYGLQ